MKIWCLQHIEPEGPGLIREWANLKGHVLERVELFAGADLPFPSAQDALLIMGGPMSVHDTALHPFLTAEIQLLRNHGQAGGRLFGVCLGAQLIAHALGGSVTRSEHREIGWFPVHSAPAMGPLAGIFPDELMVLHWHGETYSLPAGAELLCSSAACLNQGFAIGRKIVGLQFHMEANSGAAAAFVRAFPEDCSDPSAYVQAGGTIIAEGDTHSPKCAEILFKLLDAWAAEDYATRETGAAMAHAR